jgi:hypothetical protein
MPDGSSGPRWTEWVVVPNKHSATWPELGRHAVAYVAARAGKS